MKYSLMSMGFSSLIRMEKPNFLDIMMAQRAGLQLPEKEITFDAIYAFYQEKGIPFVPRTMELEDFLILAKKAGYDGVDCMNYIIELPATDMKALLHKHDLHLSSYNIIVPFNNARSYGEIKALFEENVKPGIDFAVKVGAESVLIMPTLLFLNPMLSREQAFNNIVDGLRLCVTYAKQAGITLTTETLQSIQVPYCSNGEMLRVLSAVPELAYVHDTGNLLPSLEKAEEAIDLFQDRLVGLHMKDFVFGDQKTMNLCANGKYLQSVTYGKGIVQFEMIYEKLVKWGFDGWIAFEGKTLGNDPVNGAPIDLAFFKELERKANNA